MRKRSTRRHQGSLSESTDLFLAMINMRL